ncbi:uncharacterized protein V6R79_006799 [Siganus canaliculatus]
MARSGANYAKTYYHDKQRDKTYLINDPQASASDRAEKLHATMAEVISTLNVYAKKLRAADRRNSLLLNQLQQIQQQYANLPSQHNAHHPPGAVVGFLPVYFRVVETRIVPNITSTGTDTVHLHCCPSTTFRVYKTDDVKTYGMNAVLDPIVNTIRELEDKGIEINTTHFKGIVKAGVAQVCGDNLGLNSILGYTESFAGRSVCRWCHVQREILKVQTVEDSALIRDKVNFNSDLLVNNPSETGIKRDSSLNKLQFYHVTDNVAPDIMHNILEGIGGYELKLVVNSLIEQKCFTLEQLNFRLTSFDYGFCDVHNKPSAIKPQDLKNPSGALLQSAAQTWCLLRLLPLMIGDLVPEELTNFRHIAESPITGERAIQMTEWLKNNIWSQTQVVTYMRETAIFRAQWIRSNGTVPVPQIIAEFPRLLDTPGMKKL